MSADALVAAQEALPYATGSLPGIGGAFKRRVEDFEVEELPAYAPSGEGEHLFLWIEKRGLDARTLMRHLAESLAIDERDIGCAGLKDAVAVTRQLVSVPATSEPRLARIEREGVRVLWARRHGNKLKTGHLRGNRFRVVVRDVHPEALARARAVIERLNAAGVPNYFGPQRFGRQGETLRRGLATLMRGRPGRERGVWLRLQLSAVQSALFNRYLAGRLGDDTLHRVLAGEVMQVVASGGPFIADDPAREQARLEQREITPSGPMFGPKMRAPTGGAAAREAQVLAEAGLTLEHFARFGKLLRGTRRPLLVWPAELSVDAVDGGLEARLTLPRGSYATVVLRELMKGEVALDEPDEED